MKSKVLLVSVILNLSFIAVAKEECFGMQFCFVNGFENGLCETDAVKSKNSEREKFNYDETQKQAPTNRFLTITASALTGIDDGVNRLNKSVNIVTGIRFRSGIRLGIGSGIENFDESVIPFFAFFSFPIANKITSPFVYVKGGYGIAFLSEQPSPWSDPGSYGGILWGAGASVNLFSWNRVALNAGAGYRFQKLIGKKHGPWQAQKIVDFNRIDLHLSISF